MSTDDDITFFITQYGDEALHKLGRRPGPDGKWSNEDCDWLSDEVERRGLAWFLDLIEHSPSSS
jgi:hypothetical protein